VIFFNYTILVLNFCSVVWCNFQIVMFYFSTNEHLAMHPSFMLRDKAFSDSVGRASLPSLIVFVCLPVEVISVEDTCFISWLFINKSVHAYVLGRRSMIVTMSFSFGLHLGNFNCFAILILAT